MSGPESDFLHEAQERGYIHQVTDAAALDARLRAGPVSGYIGFDCTADSLHVGQPVCRSCCCGCSSAPATARWC